jgi:cold shock CspA family protein
MAKPQQSYNKSEREKIKGKKKKDKEAKKEERRLNSDGNDSMIAYVDQYGNITSTPPDLTKKEKVAAEDIMLGVPKREEGPAIDAERKGIVTFFNESKGFGFIKDLTSQESFFTHINSHIDTITEGNKVTFTLEKGQKGLNAVNVKKV